jgi:predicted nucleotidyltransferase
MLSDGDIARIGRRIVEGYGPLVVGVFGSYGMGTASDKSDLDVFVIKRTAEHPSARRRAVLRFLVGVLHPLDVHVFTPEEFAEEALKELSFVWIIVRQARILHPTAAEAARLVPALAMGTPSDQDLREEP